MSEPWYAADKPPHPPVHRLWVEAISAVTPMPRRVALAASRLAPKGDGHPVLVLGSPGGPRITTAVLETLTGIIDFGLAPQQAVAAARFHHQWQPDILYLQNGFRQDTETALRKMGYEVRSTDSIARVEVIVGRDNTLQGGTESRAHGKVSGY